MEIDLVNVMRDLRISLETGILTVSVRDEAFLLKIFFRNGEIYHITHGTCRGAECLDRLAGRILDAGFFSRDANVDVKYAGLPETDDLIKRAEGAGKILNWRSASTGPADERAREETSPGEDIVGADALERLEQDLLQLLGPMAPFILQNVYNDCGIDKGMPLAGSGFKILIEKIRALLPDDQKKRFASKYGE